MPKREPPDHWRQPPETFRYDGSGGCYLWQENSYNSSIYGCPGPGEKIVKYEHIGKIR